MSKITPPPAMTDEEVDKICEQVFQNHKHSCGSLLISASNAARDKQWLDMLAHLEQTEAQHFGDADQKTGMYAAPVAQQADHKQVPTLPFAVFDEFGQPCEDRIRDHFAVAQQAVPDGYKLVPEAALRWLFGEEGDFKCPPENYFQGEPPAFWWRSVFRKMLAAAPEAPAPQDGDVRDAEAELNCAEEVLDALAVDLPMERTDFDCIGDYITAVIEAIRRGQAAPEAPAPQPASADAVAASVLSGDLRILNAFAAECDCLVMPMPKSLLNDGNAMMRVATLAREFGELVGTVTEATADGSITANELHRVQSEWGELMAAGQALLAHLEAKHLAGRPAP